MTRNHPPAHIVIRPTGYQNIDVYVCILEEHHLQGNFQDGIKIEFDLEIRNWSVWGWSGMETASIRRWYGRAEGGV